MRTVDLDGRDLEVPVSPEGERVDAGFAVVLVEDLVAALREVRPPERDGADGPYPFEAGIRTAVDALLEAVGR